MQEEYIVICCKGSTIVREFTDSKTKKVFYTVRYVDSLDHQRSKEFQKLDQALAFYESKKEL